MRSMDEVALVLSGGNALGAYAAGAVQALCEAGLRPSLISGASIGAVTGVLLAGNPRERWIERLQAFWSRASSPTLMPPAGRQRDWHNAAHALQALTLGRPGLFQPNLPARAWPWGAPQWADGLFDNRPLLGTLQELVDFEHLNREGTPLILNTVDLATGEPVWFDSRQQVLQAEHVRASTGFLPAFPPVCIDGRWLGDPGVFCNLPLDPVLRHEPGHRLVIAVDLFAAEGGVPHSLDAALQRAQDLAFASQTGRTLQAFRREHRLHHQLAGAGGADEGASPPGQVDVLLCAYHAPRHELAAKTLEFSSTSLDERWAAGRADLAQLLHRHAQGDADVEDLGFALYRSRPPRGPTP